MMIRYQRAATRRSRPLAIGAALLAVLALLSPGSASASDRATVTVGMTQGSSIETRMSTNNVWSGMLDQAPHGRAEFDALRAPLVRIHVGDDGFPEAMPELREGQWSFSALDALVEDVFASGEQPLMNVKFAPDWQWTCSRPQTGAAGTVRDMSFSEYAAYMARLVSYYNHGRMTTESGQVRVNPAGTAHRITYWEPWNEPDLNNETPCAPPDGHGITPSQYVRMWNAVTRAMLRVDPTLKFIGPATAGSQFGSSTTTGNEYIDQLMAGGVTKPAAISFHGYGYWDNTVADKWLFDGDRSDPATACCGGITELVHGVRAIRRRYPARPVWLTEVGVNADWGKDPLGRPNSELGAAWWGAAFQQAALAGVGMIDEYDVVDGPQFGLIDEQTGQPYVAYEVLGLLDRAFPAGSRRLLAQSSDPGILTLAALQRNGTVSVMVVDRKVPSPTARSRCGTGGLPSTVTIRLPRRYDGRMAVRQVDRSTVNCSTGSAHFPVAHVVRSTGDVSLTLPGYGVAVLTIAATRR